MHTIQNVLYNLYNMLLNSKNTNQQSIYHYKNILIYLGNLFV